MRKGHPLLTYGMALLVTGAALLLTQLLRINTGDRYPFLFYFSAVMLASWIGGLGPGLLAALASTLICALSLIGQRDLDPFWHITVPLCIFLTEGIVINVLSSIRRRALEDRTVLLDRERALHHSEAQGLAILEAALDAIVTMDHDGRVMEWNPSAVRTFGYARDEAIGRPMSELIIPPELREAHYRGLDHYLKTGEHRILGKRLELTATRKDGSRFPVELTVTRMRTEGPAMFTGHLRDITERKEAEEALRLSEERLRLGLDSGNTGTWDWDIIGNHVTWSDRVYEFHGLKPGEFSGKVEDFQKLIHPEDAQRVGAAIGRAVENNEPYDVEFRVVQPSGEVRWIATTGKVYHDPAGKPLRMLGATTDVTARKVAEQERDRLLAGERAARSEAERVSRMKDEFLAGLSHELRTPLNAILGWATMLQQSRSPEDWAQGIATIERNARAQTQIIEDLLDMSRIVSGKIRLDVQRVDLIPIIESALLTVRPAADAKEIRLHSVLDPLTGPIAGDPNRLQQIFWNLLSNALKFTPKGGKVQVLLQRVNSHIEFSVADNGEGISADFLPYVFDRFRQADASTTRHGGGLGLGLAIVKQLVELHGGTIEAKSAGRGHGATFVLSLPLTVVHPDRPAAEARRHPTSHEQASDADGSISLAGVRVLVVDDEPDARALVQRVLERCSADVTLASSVSEALERLNAQRFNVLVSDIGMPVEDGYSLIRRVRQLPTPAAEIPALALTAYARSEDRQRSILAGYQMHVAKPVEPSELVTMIASLARRSPAGT